MSSLRSVPISKSVEQIRIFVADRNPMNSQLLAESLGRNPRFEITGVAAAEKVLSLVPLHKTDVAVISAEVDGVTKKGLQLARTLNARYPDVRIVVLLDVGSRDSVIASFHCGAMGVFCRTEPLSELVACIERVSRGEIGASPTNSEFLIEALRSTPSCEGIEADKIGLLSHRELQVAECAAQGQSNRQIADRLGLSTHTIKNYLFRIFEKLGVSNRFELLFLLFRECNGQSMGRAGLGGATELGNTVENYLQAAEEGSVTAQFVVGLAHLEGYCIEKNGLSAYYWLRVAEENCCALGHRSRALAEQLRSTVTTDEIETLERNVAIAVSNNKLFTSKRPAEYIKRSTDSPPQRRAM
jgi:two-component system nitrate/nitrite response regulator NarL